MENIFDEFLKNLHNLVHGKMAWESISSLYAGQAVRSQGVHGLATDTLVSGMKGYLGVDQQHF